ncbi:MAG: PAS domain S-box protein [Deltaproteobacteria bacterium]|nr:PAS domain S-box protein [Deltaproteobacteria bacterium]
MALAARASLSPAIGAEHYPFTMLFSAIIVASWYGGIGPACLALVVGGLGAQWLFVSPRLGELPWTTDGWLGLATVAVSGGIIVAFGATMQRARQRAQASATQAERAHAALHDSELRARAVLDTAMTAIISIDERGRIESFNRAAERMFGYRISEVLGKDVTLLMPEPHRTRHDDYLRVYRQSGVAKIIGTGREMSALRKDGTTFPIYLSVNDTVLHGAHLFTAVIRDLTEQKEAEERERRLLQQALQNERLADIGAMTARIAHDFGNPLAGLHMAAQRLRLLLARDPLRVETIRGVIDTIVTTTKRLDLLVGEFKDVAREQRLQLRDIELPAFLQEVVAAWQHEAQERAIGIESGIDGDLPTIRGDEDKLRRVMDNLVKNALEAIVQGPGAVRIAAETWQGERVRIVVEDTGPGIPDGTDVFAMFETTKPTGTGLGLAICKQIALAHGGAIDCAPRLPQGAIFTVELPTHGPSKWL